MMPNQSVANPFGFKATFYTQEQPKHFDNLVQAVSSQKSPELNIAALNTFFRTGFFLNGDTPFKDIKRTWPQPKIIQPADIKYADAMEKFRLLFSQAIERNLTEKSILTLSGGCDSRHILFELSRINKKPSYAMTVCIPGVDESLIAKQLCKSTSIQHKLISANIKDVITDEAYKNTACDFSTFEHGWASCLVPVRGSLPLWDGIGGDVLSGALFLNKENLDLFNNNKLDELAESLVDKNPIPYVRDQSSYPVFDVIDCVRKELELHKNAANPVGSFYFWNRTRLSIAAWGAKLLSPDNQTILTPYLDNELWHFLSSLPAELLVDGKFHINTVKLAYPEYNYIPYYHKKAQPACTKLLRKKSVALLKYALLNKKILRVNCISRILRAFFLKKYHSDINWLTNSYVYCSQIEGLALGKL